MVDQIVNVQVYKMIEIDHQDFQEEERKQNTKIDLQERRKLAILYGLEYTSLVAVV